nr:His-Xaa-Ser system protein HxsD [uncultured Faecalibacillus sp.]
MDTLYKFNKELYSKEDLMKTSYRFIDDFYIHLDVDDQYYYVTIHPKEDKTLNEEEFVNEMLVQQTRNIINKETKNIREMIYARAMASTLIQEEQIDIEQDEDDIDDILVDWFDKYEE